jgi:hypothetical protein
VSAAGATAKAKGRAKAKKSGGPAADATITPEPTLLALAARPEPDPEVLAVIAAAADLLWPRLGAPDAQDPVNQVWRFSGRWWAQPMPLRRVRPRAR